MRKSTGVLENIYFCSLMFDKGKLKVSARLYLNQKHTNSCLYWGVTESVLPPLLSPLQVIQIVFPLNVVASRRVEH